MTHSNIKILKHFDKIQHVLSANSKCSQNKVFQGNCHWKSIGGDSQNEMQHCISNCHILFDNLWIWTFANSKQRAAFWNFQNKLLTKRTITYPKVYTKSSQNAAHFSIHCWLVSWLLILLSRRLRKSIHGFAVAS